MNTREVVIAEVWLALSKLADEASQNIGGSYEAAEYAKGSDDAADHVFGMLSEDAQTSLQVASEHGAQTLSEAFKTECQQHFGNSKQWEDLAKRCFDEDGSVSRVASHVKNAATIEAEKRGREQRYLSLCQALNWFKDRSTSDAAWDILQRVYEAARV